MMRTSKVASLARLEVGNAKIIDIKNEHVECCVQFALQFHERSVLCHVPFDEEAVRGYLYAAIYQETLDGRVAIVAEECAGALIRQSSPLVFSPNTIICSSLFFYVPPSFRTGRIPLKLMLDFEACAINDGARELYVSNTNGRFGAGLERLTQHLGYSSCGNGFRKSIMPGNLN